MGIVAARAAGTSMPGAVHVGDHYTAVNGTSMAAPHVAGAAAILAQAHPDWPGQRIKEALTAHSAPSDAYTVYQQGFGRVDIPNTLDATMELSGAGDYRVVEWKPGTIPSETRTLTFRNTGTADATLDLTDSVEDSNGSPSPTRRSRVRDGLSDGHLIVPAGGTADVTVTLDPNLVSAGQHSGYITATASSGESVHATVGFVKDIERHNVTINFVDRFGNTPSTVNLVVHGMDNTFRQSVREPAQHSKPNVRAAGRPVLHRRRTLQRPPRRPDSGARTRPTCTPCPRSTSPTRT